MLSVSGMIEGAFRLIRERPAAVAVWGLLYMAATIAIMLAIVPVLRVQAGGLGADSELGAAAAMRGIGWVFLLELLFLVLFVVLMTAAQRAVLRPEEDGFFYVRLGMDELRIFGLTLLFVFGFYFGFLITMLFAMLIAGVATIALGPVIGGALGVIGFIAVFCLALWLVVRLSLAFPLTLLRRSLILGEAWRRSKGHFWTLLGGYLVVFVINVVIFLVIGLVVQGSYFVDLANAGNDPQAIQAVMDAQLSRMSEIGPMLILAAILTAAAGAISIALMGGSTATAARLLVADEDVAETFA
jgi:hypothetical protein